MLIEFSVRNFRSLRDEQCLRLEATALAEHTDANTFQANAPGVKSLLRSIVVYGANAAGKSNLLRALMLMQEIVLYSANERQSGQPLPVTPFLLDDSASKPVLFEAIFVESGVKYQFGFEATKERIVSEWLFAFPEGRSQRLYLREYDKETGAETWKFSSLLKGAKQAWKEATRSNSLYLSTATQLNSKQLAPIFGWFQSRLRAIRGNFPDFLTAEMGGNDVSRARVSAVLRGADVGIGDWRAVETPLDEGVASIIRKIMPEDMAESALKAPNYNISFEHKATDGESIWFPMAEESEGTQRLFVFTGPVLKVLDEGSTLIVDEINNSLHPLLVRSLVSLFHSSETNPKNAQLIFSTHATSILDSDLFRRDQVWFAEKSRDGVTKLYPLSEFRPRKETSLAKGYLQGRYGAIPFLGQSLIE